jgi:hypothetical protein
MRSRADAVELAERVRVLLQLQPSICCRRVGPPKPTQSCTHTIMIMAKTKQKLVAKLVAMLCTCKRGTRVNVILRQAISVLEVTKTQPINPV